MTKPKIWSLLELFTTKTVAKSPRCLGLTYEVLYIPPHVRERLEAQK